MSRPLALSVALLAALASSACISISPELKNQAHAEELTRMSAQALKTCGEGQVREVSAKSFSCK